MTSEFKHYRFRVEYNGKAYHGWQIQPNVITVQQKLMEAFSILCKHEVHILGSGRTDTGVHAHGQAAQIQLNTSFPCDKIQNSINGILPPDIAIYDLQVCSPDFNARYGPTSRHYRYAISTRKGPMSHPEHWNIRMDLNLDALQAELAHFVGLYDFNTFSIPREDGRSTECEIFKTYFEEQDSVYYIHIIGNRFLHGMIRALVGHLIEVSRGKKDVGDFYKVINGSIISKRVWARAHGLSLYKVNYSDY